MNLAPFKNQLIQSDIGPGASWVRADFHVHLPTSSDYEYKGADAFELLAEKLTGGDYGFAIVLKHEEFPTRDELDRLQALCPRTKLIPGAEINVLVEALFKKIGKDYFCHCILAVDPDNEGDFSYVLRKAKERFTYRPGDYPAGFRSSVLDIGRFFQSEGAVFIPAHLHQSKKPETSRSIDDLYDDETFLGFIKEGAFDALEVRDKSTARFFDGHTKTKEQLEIPAAVCVASSDAHHHDHIEQRRRSTWVRVEQKTFSELKAALSFPHRVSLTVPLNEHARIVGLHIKGSFIPEAWLRMNPGINALIGAKGSGKTAILECLRFVLNTPVPQERTENVRSHVMHVLGSSGYVECLVMDENGVELLITRRADSPDRISILPKDGPGTTLSPSAGMPFPISILGWHEIEAVADSPSARIGLLDRIGDAQQVKELYAAIGQLIEQARDSLPILQRQIKRLDTLLKQLWDLQKKRNALKRLEEGELLDLQRQYEWFLATEQRLNALVDKARGRLAVVDQAVSSHLELSLSPAPNASTAQKVNEGLKATDDAIVSGKRTEEEVATNLKSAVSQVEANAFDATSRLQQDFQEFRDNIYTPKVNALSEEDRSVLTRQIQVLEETKHLEIVEQKCADLATEVSELARQLQGFCQQVCSNRDKVAQLREETVDKLNAEVESVQVTFHRSANKESRGTFQNRYAGAGSDFFGYLDEFGKQETYQNLVELFGGLSNLRTDESAWQIGTMLWDVKMVDLLNVIDDDDIEIRLAVGRAGFVPLQNLSAGQRSVAVFPLLLRNTRGPLVIDQPEDNLDNRYIADVIAVDLLRRKTNQQFMVTSHNANLVVLTDADLIVHVDSDGAASTFPSSGFLSCTSSRVRGSVLDVLDGGAVALRARQHKYGVHESSV